MATNPNSMVQEALDAAISKRGEIGLQVVAYVDGKQVVDVWGGLADITTGRQVDADTLFPVFSVTKAVTAVALHIQAERGLVDYAMPIAHYWPEFGAHGKDKATVYDALTHRLGVPIMPLGVTPELMCDWDWMVQRIADMHPLFEPGTKAAYVVYFWVGHRRSSAAQRSAQQAVWHLHPGGNLSATGPRQPLGGHPGCGRSAGGHPYQYAADPSGRAWDGPWSAQPPGDSAAGGDDPGGVWTG